jgi:hypothetical protein
LATLHLPAGPEAEQQHPDAPLDGPDGRLERKQEKMTDTRRTQDSTEASAPYSSHRKPTHTAWAGWIMFAGVMMILLGVFQAMEGLVALVNDDYYAVTRSGLVVSADFTVWGWVHLLLGLVVAAAGLGVMIGQMWARVVGIIVALLSAIVNLGFLAAYPVGSTIIITIDVLVIYALTVHGRETKTDYA